MVDRRRFLSLVSAASLGALAGCPSPPSPPGFSTDNNSPNEQAPQAQEGIDGVKPSSPPPNIPDYDCDNNRMQHKPFVDFGDVLLGETDKWKMTLSSTTVAIGNAFTVNLVNTTDYTQRTASKWMFNIQMYTTDGWQEIRHVENQLPYSTNQITHQSGSGFEWKFICSDEDLLVEHPHSEKMIICPEIQPGRYRFIFSHPSLSVQFNVIE